MVKVVTNRSANRARRSLTLLMSPALIPLYTTNQTPCVKYDNIQDGNVRRCNYKLTGARWTLSDDGTGWWESWLDHWISCQQMEASSNPSAAVELVRSRRCSRLQTLHWRIASADWSHHSQAPESRDTKSHFIHAEWFAIENIVQHGLMFGWRLATNICGLDCICHTWRHGKGYTCGLGKEKKRLRPNWGFQDD